jgi:hypothetical protein
MIFGNHVSMVEAEELHEPCGAERSLDHIFELRPRLRFSDILSEFAHVGMTDGGVKGLNDLIEWFGRDDTKALDSYWTNRHAAPAFAHWM